MPSCLDVRDISLIVGWEWDPFIYVICQQSSAKGTQKNRARLKCLGYTA